MFISEAQYWNKSTHFKQIIAYVYEIFFEIKDTTTVPFGTDVILAPGDVNPGHIILAPLRTKRIAPLSTCSHGRKNGSGIITYIYWWKYWN